MPGLTVDGGVDALVGKQTRQHDALDLVIGPDYANGVQVALETLGFRVAAEELPTLCRDGWRGSARGLSHGCSILWGEAGRPFRKAGSSYTQLMDSEDEAS